MRPSQTILLQHCFFIVQVLSISSTRAKVTEGFRVTWPKVCDKAERPPPASSDFSVSSPTFQSMDSAESLGQWESCLARSSMEKQSSIDACNSQSKETVFVKLVGIVAPYEQAAAMNDGQYKCDYA
ncbi:hypothetical protein ARMSODRAFT_37113 [Armillaria solidipes]|uniref:Uncharacterized protein n=1 Tax=Armillaria solidipes TaxID=1076256 RepID=A0A2H3CGM3_9AGAR|nr:hypothetical protein ARMSODRAFT_37113 [Armillaria solidipes]